MPCQDINATHYRVERDEFNTFLRVFKRLCDKSHAIRRQINLERKLV
jgi:hypothetical protein